MIHIIISELVSCAFNFDLVRSIFDIRVSQLITNYFCYCCLFWSDVETISTVFDSIFGMLEMNDHWKQIVA